MNDTLTPRPITPEPIDGFVRLLIGNYGSPVSKIRPNDLTTLRWFLDDDWPIPIRSFAIADLDGWRRELFTLIMAGWEQQGKTHFLVKYDPWTPDVPVTVLGLAMYDEKRDFWGINPFDQGPVIMRPDWRTGPDTLTVSYTFDPMTFDKEEYVDFHALKILGMESY
jgi:hypothetical protein